MQIIVLDLALAAGLSLSDIEQTLRQQAPNAALLRWAITAATPELWHIEAVLTTPAS